MTTRPLTSEDGMGDPGLGREQQVIRAFVGLADTLVDDYDTIDLLDRLVGHCVELLAAEAAGILLVDATRNLRLVASTNEQTEWTELLQLQADEGPCVECFRTGEAVSVSDLDEGAARWPGFVAGLAGREGTFRSVHALPLRLRGEAIGALNLFHRRPGPLPAADLALAQAMADVATIGILSERAVRRGEVLNEQLQTALDNRVIIEQAKGVLAQYGGLSMDEAFSRLRGHARNQNRRLSDVAREIVETDLVSEVISVRHGRRRGAGPGRPPTSGPSTGMPERSDPTA